MISACGGGKTRQATEASGEETAVETLAPSKEETTAETPAASREETAIETQASESGADSGSSSEAEIKIISGEVKAVGMSTITIVTKGGEEISFLKEDTEVDVADGIQEGVFVTITYKETDQDLTAVFITDAVEP